MSGGPKTVGRWWKDWKERKKEVSNHARADADKQVVVLVDDSVPPWSVRVYHEQRISWKSENYHVGQSKPITQHSPT